MKFNYCFINRYKLFLILIVSLAAPLCFSANAQMFGDDAEREATIYTIYNVEVDETSRNVTTSRDRALRKGRRSALERLFRRIILSTDRNKLASFSDLEVEDFISGFEIHDEKRSNVRYIASLVVHFNRAKVNEVLSEYQIPYAETLGTAVSVLPVLNDAGTLRLWEKDNLWRLAWQEYDVINNLVPIETPLPTLRNRMYISALQANNDDQKSITSFIERNELNDLIIATATFKKDNLKDTIALDISLKRSALSDEELIEQTTLSVSLPSYNELGESNIDVLYKAGVDAATDWVDDLWKLKVLVNYGISSKIYASGNLRKINDWLIIQKQLNKINLIKTVNLKNITIEAIDLEIEFSGDTEQLALSLAQQGLSLRQNEENMLWEIGLVNPSARGQDFND